MAELFKNSVFFAHQANKQEDARIVAFLVGLVDSMEWLLVLFGSGGSPGHVRHILSSASGEGRNA